MHSIAGATQVKWSRMNSYTLATGHEGDIRIWDKRVRNFSDSSFMFLYRVIQQKSNAPIHYISAHLTKINCIDWNPSTTSQFVTCSQDGNIKFWDLNNLKNKAENTLSTGLPVWRARYTPFKNGLVTALVPQLRRTGENNSLWMWNVQAVEQPVHSFAGHLDVVLDFAWYTRANKEFELVTWAKDNALRLWKVDSNIIYQRNGLHIGEPKDEAEPILDSINDDANQANLSFPDSNRILELSTSPSSSKVDSGRSENEDSDNISISNNIILNLNQEFSLFNENIPNIVIEELNASKRICIISVKSSVNCRLRIDFPPSYPYNVIPQFTFLNDHEIQDSPKSLNESMKKELIKMLQTTATAQVQRNRSCLEKCLRQFVQTFEKLTASNQQSNSSQKTQTTLLDLLPSHKYGSYLDASVPFPRTSGARFCSSEILVCFGRPPHLEQMNVPAEFTPRSLSALSAYLTVHVRAYNNYSNLKDNAPSISSFYESKKRKGVRHKNYQQEKASPKHKSPSLCGPVSVFAVSKCLPISRSLAEQYLITGVDIITFCETNAMVASNTNRRDLAYTWNLIKLSAGIYLKNYYNPDQFMTSWAEHPFGRRMIESM